MALYFRLACYILALYPQRYIILPDTIGMAPGTIRRPVPARVLRLVI